MTGPHLDRHRRPFSSATYLTPWLSDPWVEPPQKFECTRCTGFLAHLHLSLSPVNTTHTHTRLTAARQISFTRFCRCARVVIAWPVAVTSVETVPGSTHFYLPSCALSLTAALTGIPSNFYIDCVKLCPCSTAIVWNRQTERKDIRKEYTKGRKE